MTKRQGDWMQTASGGMFWPVDPDAGEIGIDDIAHALSMQCRFAGHCTRFYSVAEHSCLVSDAAPREHALWALLHDASEAYIVDVPRPLKPFLTNYQSVEAVVMDCICDKFGLSRKMPKEVKELDGRILVNEMEQNMAPPPHPWTFLGNRIEGLELQCWTPEQAQEQFLTRFYRLWK